MIVYTKYDSGGFDQPDDLKKILAFLHENGVLEVSARKVEELYREYSCMHSAGWLCADEKTIEAFADWLDGMEL